ncbi:MULTISPECIES: hypothetical protein [unclassified Streptomyces]|uniref:hypothetical protein n=1 Tax=unclassified Streptomyces TaxID=2593676 RepID=UPI0029A9EE7C|nr:MULTISPECIES: hypothetical protein [unclassified Streptomyces]MDX3766396.1 hypothetical protein [Streptomyces sp. AK08-01B]MDX3816348.1 hypothetical protein [Streptomyces sp. AK08-01A]
MNERMPEPDERLTSEVSVGTSIWAGIERFRTAVMLAIHPDIEVLDDRLNRLYRGQS